MGTWNRRILRSVVPVLLCVSWSVVAPAQADEYQDAIAKAFPGFKILSRTEFTNEIQKTVKGNPGLITGRFNDDELVDFAAIIRSESKQKGQLGGEYHRGMFVVCHAMDKQRYACQLLGQRAIDLPFFLYLYRVEPGRVVCRDANNKKFEQIIKRNAIGTAEIDRGSISVEIHRPDGSYLDC